MLEQGLDESGQLAYRKQLIVVVIVELKNDVDLGLLLVLCHG